MQQQEFEERARFITELAKRLHEYGTSAPRLEVAVASVSERLDIACQIWSNPTGIMMSFADRTEGDDPLPKLTQVVRLNLGGNNLKRLCEADRIAEQVASGKMDISQGYSNLRTLRSNPSRKEKIAITLSFGISACAIAVLFKTALAGVLLAAVLGLAVGVMALLQDRYRSLESGFEAIAAFFVVMVASAFNAFVAPIAVNSVLISGLIVLLPGLMLTTAVAELATQNLASGVARFAGAITILLKLAIGALAGVQLAKILGWQAMGELPASMPVWLEWPALLASSLSFAVLFRASLADFPLVMASAWLGYGCTRLFGALGGAEFGVFLAGLVVGSAANLYAKTRNRPGALVRMPGIILLVPGSIGFKTLFFVFERDVFVGLDTAAGLLVILMSLVAGLLFGNILVPPRKTL